MKFQDYVASLPYNGYLVNTDQPRPLSGRDRIQSKSLFLTYPPPMVSSFSLIQTAHFLSILRLSYLSRSCSQFVQIYVMTCMLWQFQEFYQPLSYFCSTAKVSLEGKRQHSMLVCSLIQNWQSSSFAFQLYSSSWEKSFLNSWSRLTSPFHTF